MLQACAIASQTGCGGGVKKKLLGKSVASREFIYYVTLVERGTILGCFLGGYYLAICDVAAR